MNNVPIISQFTSNPILIAEVGELLKKLSEITLISELTPHTCDSVNVDQYSATHLRITQTRNRSKVVVAFTRGEEAICFMVKSADKRSYDQSGIIAALVAAANSCKITVINMIVTRSQPMSPVRISMHTHQRCRRTRKHPDPSYVRKGVAAGLITLTLPTSKTTH